MSLPTLRLIESRARIGHVAHDHPSRKTVMSGLFSVVLVKSRKEIRSRKALLERAYRESESQSENLTVTGDEITRDRLLVEFSIFLQPHQHVRVDRANRATIESSQQLVHREIVDCDIQKLYSFSSALRRSGLAVVLTGRNLFGRKKVALGLHWSSSTKGFQGSRHTKLIGHDMRR